jgi:hypothetical protein
VRPGAHRAQPNSSVRASAASARSLLRARRRCPYFHGWSRPCSSSSCAPAPHGWLPALVPPSDCASAPPMAPGGPHLCSSAPPFSRPGLKLPRHPLSSSLPHPQPPAVELPRRSLAPSIRSQPRSSCAREFLWWTRAGRDPPHPIAALQLAARPAPLCRSAYLPELTPVLGFSVSSMVLSSAATCRVPPFSALPARLGWMGIHLVAFVAAGASCRRFMCRRCWLEPLLVDPVSRRRWISPACLPENHRVRWSPYVLDLVLSQNPNVVDIQLAKCSMERLI